MSIQWRVEWAAGHCQPAARHQQLQQTQVVQSEREFGASAHLQPAHGQAEAYGDQHPVGACH